ncbi:MAG: response regulator transcription factor [Nitrospirae bacterium]|nr:response regulator transcription factor [Nitrospirota bacterium]
MPPIKVLVVDDHTLFRKGIIHLLQQRDGIEVVGEAKDGREGIALAKQLLPDVILMDVQMPECNGIEATEAIRQELPDIRIIMLTVSEQDEDLFSAIKAGARGYLLKSVEPDHLLKSIDLLMKGEAVIPHNMASKLLTEFSAIAHKPAASGDSSGDYQPLTNREKEILQTLSGGASNKEIGNTLHISEHTVKIHLKNILKKLHMNNRIQAAIYAHQHGLVADAPKAAPHTRSGSSGPRR